MSRGRRALILIMLAVIGIVATVSSVHIFRRQPQPGPAIAGLASTPPLGWNSWNVFGCNIDEQRIERTAQAMVSSGMRDAGYRYVVVDDCWFDPRRNASGELRANPARFPHGMKAVADFVHARGLLFGIYASPGEATCAQNGGSYPGRTGSRGHEIQDAQTFARWGVDYVKYDWCGPPADVDELVDSFTIMRDALRATGRPILYSINPNSGTVIPPSRYDSFTGVATMTRVSQDLVPAWGAIDAYDTSLGIVDALANAAGPGFRCTPQPGFFCDYDMLVAGAPQVAGIDLPPLNTAESRAQLALWAEWGSPLIAGNDLTHMPEDIRALLINRDLLAIDQDSLRASATALAGSGGTIWTRPLGDGSTAIVIVNRDDVAQPFRAAFSALGLPKARRFDVLDVFSGQRSVQQLTYRTSLAAHDARLLRVRAIGDQ
ncbi:glycoside hydrolase family 27 protein [Mycobacteroides abscessus subsp. abscessus]|uniref:glycoside hydrolase family 27 protein n=1 Tax=Mycobacteroides abscessus TaxID=36809 RepID=UPI00046A4034|nr:glycoside hydrolase family 27 protein [Mycobacteroides abscessus]MDM2349665.1 glycoside hydrolase family 27 protein [Mycobacteroides abscessus]MDM2361359.1 glycoside hydrolase family 27 protein [Mycobacteroides abscessus]MDO3106518.1 glycoside hydrolase family 27 protein [Mycobacteroides abscessus subsp. abscessus]QSN51708.1 glycoside hydrolase family 27 protein [Mycobacteroides abscessus subsp. abscessus]SHV70903.1 alpha galactosidase [Mycobacteroides abscessus subsp. abscessus]